MTLSAYLAKVCGTATFTGTGSSMTQSFSTGTCSNQYISPMSVTALQGEAPLIFTWFLNSLIDPPPNVRPLR